MDIPEKPAPPAATPRRKIYRAPVLSQYGEVIALTGGNMGGSGDNGTAGPTTKMCWIAETLYGVDSPRVALLRGWLVRCYERRVWWALAVVPLYRRFGERAAAAIRRRPLLGEILRPGFDRAVRRAFRDDAGQAVARRTPA